MISAARRSFMTFMADSVHWPTCMGRDVFIMGYSPSADVGVRASTAWPVVREPSAGHRHTSAFDEQRTVDELPTSVRQALTGALHQTGFEQIEQLRARQADFDLRVIRQVTGGDSLLLPDGLQSLLGTHP